MTERNSSRFLLLLNKNKQNHLEKMMESSYHMALSDRARNYEAIGTGFAFLGFFYIFLQIIKLPLKSNKNKNYP
jgi:hypothetical protein